MTTPTPKKTEKTDGQKTKTGSQKQKKTEEKKKDGQKNTDDQKTKKNAEGKKTEKKTSGKKINKTKALKNGLQATAVVADAVCGVANLAPVPGLQIAVSTAISILNMVAQTNNNKKAFKQIAKEAANIVLAFDDSFKKMSDKEQNSEMMIQNVAELRKIMEDIQALAQEKNERHFFKRFIQHVSDLHKISKIRRKLDKAIDVFKLKSIINHDQKLESIRQKLEDLVLPEHPVVSPDPPENLAPVSPIVQVINGNFRQTDNRVMTYNYDLHNETTTHNVYHGGAHFGDNNVVGVASKYKPTAHEIKKPPAVQGRTATTSKLRSSVA
ncbi:hypothetical protein BDQ17DRAFT_1430099 [Cyathus striatus]|nr:hypothetical protein BDQ17DRAFT_1430099 [Cyathus striatus]